MLINIHVSNNNACAKCGALLTSGMVGARCAFSFGAEWNGLAKTAVFVAGNIQKDVLLTENECVIPWEVLKKQGYQLYIGVYGTNASGDLVIPTIYVNIGVIKNGADPNGEEGADPTPTIVEQIIAAAGTAVNIANSVREDADNGVFDGAQGERGPAGTSGQDGVDGADAKINGYNTVNIVAGDNITIDQDGNTLTINGEAGGGGTGDHRELTNRDAANQHPISAIDGLQTALNGKQPVGDYALRSDIPSVPTALSQLSGDSTHRVVTDAEKSTWNAKQSAISDLAAIRSGAALGATALQSVPSGYATEAYVDGEINDVQEQIDAIVSRSDVVDVVGTYAELQAYDTSSLGENDVVKVLNDSAHSNQRSYYRWVSGAWSYVGSESVGYTKAETDTLLNGKQNTISDLATIRSGASKGATAVQPETGKGLFSGNYNDLTNKPTIPSAVTESTVSGWGFTKNTGTYSKPSGGIPKTDLASAVQTSLSKADTALQSVPSTYALKSDLPTKTSDLTNDSGYLTLETLPIYDGGVV